MKGIEGMEDPGGQDTKSGRNSSRCGLYMIAGYPPIRFAHSRENQVLRKSKHYVAFFFF